MSQVVETFQIKIDEGTEGRQKKENQRMRPLPFSFPT